MLIPTTRAPGILARTFIHSLAPSVCSLCAHLPALKKPEKIEAPKPSGGNDPIHFPSQKFGPDGSSSRSRPADSAAASSLITGLYGIRNAERIVGQATLHYVMKRDFNSVSVKPAATTPPHKPMIEPYGSIIKSLEPDFHKIGFFNIHEDEYSVTFSDGTHQVYLATERNEQPSLTELFIDKNGRSEALWILQNRLNSAAEENQEFLDRSAIRAKYRMDDSEAPMSLKEEGSRACMKMSLQRMISFIETHKGTLSELT